MMGYRMERLGFGTWAGKAKVVGTLLCIAGAMLLTFYKGAEINIWSTSVDLLHKGPNHVGHVTASHQKAGNPVLGALLVVCCCFSMAMGLIVQAKMMRNYPCPYSSTAIMITFGAIQATVFALCMEKDWSQWKLGWDIRLLTVSYTVYILYIPSLSYQYHNGSGCIIWFFSFPFFDQVVYICVCIYGLFCRGLWPLELCSPSWPGVYKRGVHYLYLFSTP